MAENEEKKSRMVPPATHLSASSSEQLGLIEQQHQALRSALKITQAIEQLQSGLQAVLLLGLPSENINNKVMQTFSALSKRTQAMSRQKLELTVAQLDAQIAASLAVILTIAKSEDFAAIDGLVKANSSNQGMDQQVADALLEFRKKAQTAVALRILLQARGVPSKPLRLNVPAEDLERELRVLEHKEQRCRAKVKHEITVLKQDLAGLLNRADISPYTRKAALHIQEDLQRDLEHIQAGKPIAELPSAMEVIELCAESYLPATAEGPLPGESPTPTAATVLPIVHTATAPTKVGWLQRLLRRLFGERHSD